MLKRHRRIEKSKTPIEEIIAKTPMEENALRRRVWIEGVVLSLPLFVSFAFYINIIFKSTQPVTGAQLSPEGNVQSLVFFIFAFILVYGLFLVFEYSRLKKKLEKNRTEKKKGSKKIHRRK